MLKKMLVAFVASAFAATVFAQATPAKPATPATPAVPASQSKPEADKPATKKADAGEKKVSKKKAKAKAKAKGKDAK